jgi:hypothetical protein
MSMLKVGEAVLVIVDVQGKLAESMFERDRLYGNLRILIKGCQILQTPILWLEQYPKGLGPTVPEIAELLADGSPIAKVSFSGCGQADFVERLRECGRRQVLIAGIESHVCVYQTARDLLEDGYHVEVVADAVSSRTAENRRVGLDRMAQAGAAITSVEMVLFELMERAGTPEFKEIVGLVK